MTDFFLQIGLSNACFSVALAIVAMVVGATTKRPHLAHMLWLLVFIKLLTPPIVTIPIVTIPGQGETAIAINDLSQPGPPVASVHEFDASRSGPPVASGPEFDASRPWPPVANSRELDVDEQPDASLSARIGSVVLNHVKEWLPPIWLLGSLVVFAWSLVRVCRFGRLLAAESEVAPQQLQTAAAKIARRLELNRIPMIHTTSARLSPLVWWAGGKVRIFIPTALLEKMDAQQWQWVLAHELAHVRRRDHLVRWLEWLACVCFWWNPVVWWARYNLRANEELCCDALVVSSLEPTPKSYANSLLTAIECLACPAPRPPVVASEINSGGFLERRFKMIVSETPKRSNSRWVQICVLLCAMVVLPLGIASAQDYSAVAKRLKKAVKKGEITQEHADVMMAALKKEKSPEADDERDLPASRSRKPLGPVPPYATRAEGKLEFDKKIDLHFSHARIATSSIVLTNSTPSILFSNREGRVVAQLPINIHPEFGGTWWVHVGLLDDAGRIVAADEQQYTMEETVRISDLLLIEPNLTHTLDFDLGLWKERSIATRFAVTVEQYPPLMTKQLKMQPGKSVARQQPFRLEEPAKIDLRHPSGGVVQWIVFRHEKDRLRGQLHVSFPSGPKTAWKAGVELLDEAGKTLAEGETRFENDGLVRDHLAFVRLKAFEFDFGPRDDVSNIKRLAVNIGQLAPGDNSMTGAPVAREAGRAAEVPSPAELLAKLKATDALYRRGFTVAGTSVHGWPKTKHEWRLTMGNGQVALLQRAVEILDQKENRLHPALEKLRNETLIPAVFPMVHLEKAVFVSPEYCAQRWCQKNPPVDLPEPGGYRYLSFMSVTSALYTREVFWVMGRGLSEHIQEITKVSKEADGKLKAVVTTDLGLNPCELIVEPEADYMIRWGKVSYAWTFSNSGLKRIGERCVPLKGKWDGAEVVFEQASAEPDQKFLQEVEKMMHPPYATLMPVRDERVWPPLAAEFFEMRRGEGIRIGQIVVPIHCKGIGHPDGKKRFETRQAAPRQEAEQFLAAFLKGDEEAVNDLIAPGSPALADLAGLRKAIGDVAALEVRGVRFAGERAVILSSDIPVGSDAALKAPVFLRLAKYGDRWLIERVEGRIEEPFTRRLTRLLSERD